MNTTTSLTAGPISRGLIQLAFPILCANILQCLNGTVSAFWVGRFLGEAALSALTNAQSLMILLTGTSFGIATAATILVGQRMGVADVAGARRVVGTGVVVFSALSIALAVLGLAFAEPLLIMMRTAPEALALAIPYLRVMLLALPSLYLLAFVMSLLLGIGDSKTPLRFVVLSVSLGAVFTPAFVLGGAAIAGAGVVGAAVASCTAQALCLAALLRYLYRRRHPLCLTQEDAKNLRVDWSIARELVRKGIPMGAQVLVVSLSSVLMVALVNRFGVETTAAYGALLQLWTYILMPALAMAAAVSTVAAQNVGARNWRRVKHTAHLGMGYSFAVTGTIVAIVYAAESHAYRLFLPAGSPALDIASHVNSIVTWSLAFMSIPLVLFGVMRAAGAVMVPLLVHILSLLFVRYPLAALFLDRWQADAIWWSFTISAMVDVLLAILYYRYGGWHRTEGEQSSVR
ncbi:MATE family efflux transporter [Steroidobacter cummioxidans]|uniref:MATE family efflux transporter n=1 Tax=Steroidobacter cummioxidans TaxID=1803913 RepID=UPI0023AF8155|nr:MATE family efflux transporter [Steroidobacter cummioxidans]